MRKMTFAVVAALALSVLAFAQGGAKQSSETKRAEEILKAARNALGGEAKLKAVQSLSANGKYRRVISGNDVSGEIEFNFSMPDKYMKNETMLPAPSISISSIDIVNGGNIILDSRTSGPGHIVFSRPGGPNATPEQRAAAERAVREEYTRLLVSWLLTAPSAYPVEFKYAGEAEAPDGRANVLALTGQGGFSAHLFLDQKSNLPLMISYKGIAPRLAMQTNGGVMTGEDLQKKIKDQMDKNPSGIVEYQLRFSEYRAVDGVLVPFHITKSMGGEVSEEWHISKYKVNSPISPDKFAKK